MVGEDAVDADSECGEGEMPQAADDVGVDEGGGGGAAELPAWEL